jgi:hypothetical protein
VKKKAALCDIALCSLVEADRSYRGVFVSIVRAVIALVMDAVRTSETTLYFYETARRHLPESCHLQRDVV